MIRVGLTTQVIMHWLSLLEHDTLLWIVLNMSMHMHAWNYRKIVGYEPTE